MSRKKHAGLKPSSSAKPGSRETRAAGTEDDSLLKHLPSQAAVREIIESVVIAFVLAFLFRTFEAEAFVIPTGSMAPTLMGRHKDLECPNCRYPFQVSASDEVTATGKSRGRAFEVVSCTCPMCRFTVDAGPDKHRSFKGDRILVNKFAYQFSEPRRWDVAVFKFPGEAATNYIKRIIGLPGETVRISHGDIFTRAAGKSEFGIARKPPAKVLAMLQPVYDNDYVAPGMIEKGWPARWQSWPSPAGSTRGAWVTSEDFRAFRADGSAEGEVWLRYQHFVPSYEDWQRLGRGPVRPKPQLISDFAAYNTNRDRTAVERHAAPDVESFGPHWVGDLAVECVLEVESQAGQAVFELVEAGHRMQCRIDLATGQATLSIDGLDGYRPTAKTGMRGPGQYRVTFANVDDQLLVWVDGRLAEFDAPTEYAGLDGRRPQSGDLAPVGIAAADGAALRASRVKVFRDVYYIAERGTGNGAISDFAFGQAHYGRATPQSVADFLSAEHHWDAFLHLREVEFPLDKDQFLALGDNSARSRDSRLWEKDGIEYYVDRRLLIGKALFIYWPHSWDRVCGTNIPFPYFPNFDRMGFVR